MSSYIWESAGWPHFTYDAQVVSEFYEHYLYQKGSVDAIFSFLDNSARSLLTLKAIATETVKSSEIEGESISYDSVLSSVARHLDIALEIKARNDAYAQSVSMVVLDALQHDESLSMDRLLSWHKRLFQSVPPGLVPKHVGVWRTEPVYVMHHGGLGNGETLYEGVPASRVPTEVALLIAWIDGQNEKRPLIKSALASLWFVLIHPFNDGNGRISRALADYVLTQGEQDNFHYFSLSKQIMDNRAQYYEQLALISGQKDSLDVTGWLIWYIGMAIQALTQARESFSTVVRRGQILRFLDPNQFNTRQVSMLIRLAENSFLGKLTKEKWMKILKCTAATAVRDINTLVANGLLIRSQEGGRSTYYTLDQQSLDSLLPPNLNAIHLQAQSRSGRGT